MSTDHDTAVRARALIAEALELNVTELPDAPDVDSVERWDSLGHLAVVAALSKAANRDIAMAEAITLISLDAIVSWLDRQR